MSEELEAAAMASVGALSSGETSGERTTCRNCESDVSGKYCGQCGQLAQSFHRPVIGLVAEVFADFLSLDGRVAKTIPAMIFAPGRVTKSYLDGKRQAYVPPFRLYILSSLMFFLTLFFVVDQAGWSKFHDFSDVNVQAEFGEEDVREEIQNAIGDTEIVAGPLRIPLGSDEEEDRTVEKPEPEISTHDEGILLENGRVNRKKFEFKEGEHSEIEREFVNLLNSAADAYENPPVFFASLKEWAPRFILLMAPLTIVSLILVFPFRKGVYFYHHVITALHLQTWLYMLTTFVVVLSAFGHFWIASLFLFAPQIYIYRMFRKVYDSGRFLGIIRMLLVTGFLQLALFCILLVVLSYSAAETSEMIQNSAQ